MRKTFLFIFILIFLILNSIPNILAICTEGQININSASLEELDKLAGIGPVKAQAIIDTRPFQSLDNLIDVVGIGEVILANIKQQGLDCVEGEEKSTQEEDQEQEEENTEEEKNVEDEEESDEAVVEEDIKEELKEEQTQNIIQEKEEIQPIVLSSLNPNNQNTQNIKTETNKQQLDKNKLAIYELVIFCILLFFLFRLKKRKNEKSEFK